MFRIKQESFTNSKDFLSLYEPRYYAIVAIPLAVFIWGYLKWSKIGFSMPMEEVNFTEVGIAIGVYILLHVIIFWYYRSKFKKAGSDIPLKDRIGDYYSFSLQFYLMMATIALTCALLYAYTWNGYYGIMYCVHLIMIASERPTKNRIVRKLRLNKDQRDVVLFERELG